MRNATCTRGFTITSMRASVWLIAIAAAKTLNAQSPIDSATWRQWIAGAVGVSFVDVTGGSADAGGFAEVRAGGVRCRLSIGVRGIGWSRAELIGATKWSGVTATGFDSYALPSVPAFRIVAGAGWAEGHKRGLSVADPACDVEHLMVDAGAELRFLGHREHGTDRRSERADYGYLSEFAGIPTCTRSLRMAAGIATTRSRTIGLG